jgi:hypothetical protein
LLRPSKACAWFEFVLFFSSAPTPPPPTSQNLILFVFKGQVIILGGGDVKTNQKQSKIKSKAIAMEKKS